MRLKKNVWIDNSKYLFLVDYADKNDTTITKALDFFLSQVINPPVEEIDGLSRERFNEITQRIENNPNPNKMERVFLGTLYRNYMKLGSHESLLRAKKIESIMVRIDTIVAQSR